MYLFAFMAVFICIISNLLIDVIIKKGSLIFVKMSEDLQIDAQIKPAFRNRDKIGSNFHLNFSRVEEMNMDKSMGLLSPRVMFEAINVIRGRDTAWYQKYGT